MYNHSPIVQKEQAKDNFLFILGMGLIFLVAERSRKITWDYEAAFGEYMDAKLSHRNFVEEQK